MQLGLVEREAWGLAGWGSKEQALHIHQQR